MPDKHELDPRVDQTAPDRIAFKEQIAARVEAALQGPIKFPEKLRTPPAPPRKRKPRRNLAQEALVASAATKTPRPRPQVNLPKDTPERLAILQRIKDTQGDPESVEALRDYDIKVQQKAELAAKVQELESKAAAEAEALTAAGYKSTQARIPGGDGGGQWGTGGGASLPEEGATPEPGKPEVLSNDWLKNKNITEQQADNRYTRVAKAHKNPGPGEEGHDDAFDEGEWIYDEAVHRSARLFNEDGSPQLTVEGQRAIDRGDDFDPLKHQRTDQAVLTQLQHATRQSSGLLSNRRPIDGDPFGDHVYDEFRPDEPILSQDTERMLKQDGVVDYDKEARLIADGVDKKSARDQSTLIKPEDIDLEDPDQYNRARLQYSDPADPLTGHGSKYLHPAGYGRANRVNIDTTYAWNEENFNKQGGTVIGIMEGRDKEMAVLNHIDQKRREAEDAGDFNSPYHNISVISIPSVTLGGRTSMDRLRDDLKTHDKNMNARIDFDREIADGVRGDFRKQMLDTINGNEKTAQAYAEAIDRGEGDEYVIKAAKAYRDKKYPVLGEQKVQNIQRLIEVQQDQGGYEGSGNLAWVAKAHLGPRNKNVLLGIDADGSDLLDAKNQPWRRGKDPDPVKVQADVQRHSRRVQAMLETTPGVGDVELLNPALSPDRLVRQSDFTYGKDKAKGWDDDLGSGGTLAAGQISRKSRPVWDAHTSSDPAIANRNVTRKNNINLVFNALSRISNNDGVAAGSQRTIAEACINPKTGKPLSKKVIGDCIRDMIDAKVIDLAPSYNVQRVPSKDMNVRDEYREFLYDQFRASTVKTATGKDKLSGPYRIRELYRPKFAEPITFEDWIRTHT